jgi:pSer/pThr/pTyr-binding forkhead associated (FHA) protein
MNESEAAASESAVAVPVEMLPIEVQVLDHYGHATRRVVRSLPAIIGRNDRAEIILTDPWVSHEHCKLLEQEGRLIVRDMGSKNGVFLHGARVLEAEVHSGDCLTVGRTEITVRCHNAACHNGAVVAEYPATDGNEPARQRSPSPHTEELLY